MEIFLAALVAVLSTAEAQDDNTVAIASTVPTVEQSDKNAPTVPQVVVPQPASPQVAVPKVAVPKVVEPVQPEQQVAQAPTLTPKQAAAIDLGQRGLSWTLYQKTDGDRESGLSFGVPETDNIFMNALCSPSFGARDAVGLTFAMTTPGVQPGDRVLIRVQDTRHTHILQGEFFNENEEFAGVRVALDHSDAFFTLLQQSDFLFFSSDKTDATLRIPTANARQDITTFVSDCRQFAQLAASGNNAPTQPTPQPDATPAQTANSNQKRWVLRRDESENTGKRSVLLYSNADDSGIQFRAACQVKADVPGRVKMHFFGPIGSKQANDEVTFIIGLRAGSADLNVVEMDEPLSFTTKIENTPVGLAVAAVSAPDFKFWRALLVADKVGYGISGGEFASFPVDTSTREIAQFTNDCMSYARLAAGNTPAAPENTQQQSQPQPQQQVEQQPVAPQPQQPQQNQPAQQFKLVCENGRKITLEFGPGKALVDYEGLPRLELPPLAGQESTFSDGFFTFVVVNDQLATLAWAGKKLNCNTQN